MKKPTLSIDFDGVLHGYGSGWRGARTIPDAPVDGAIAFLHRAVEHFDVAIFSARSHQFGGRRAMKRWLIAEIGSWYWDQLAHGRLDVEAPEVYADVRDCLTHRDVENGFREAAKRLVRKIRFPKHKPAAMVGIDDRVLTFDGTFPSVDELQAFKPWNRRRREGELGVDKLLRRERRDSFGLGVEEAEEYASNLGPGAPTVEDDAMRYGRGRVFVYPDAHKTVQPIPMGAEAQLAEMDVYELRDLRECIRDELLDRGEYDMDAVVEHDAQDSFEEPAGEAMPEEAISVGLDASDAEREAAAEMLERLAESVRVGELPASVWTTARLH